MTTNENINDNDNSHARLDIKVDVAKLEVKTTKAQETKSINGEDNEEHSAMSDNTMNKSAERIIKNSVVFLSDLSNNSTNIQPQNQITEVFC